MSRSPFSLRHLNRWIAAIALFLIAGGMMGCNGATDYPRPAAFAGYPANASFDRVIETHVNAGTDPAEESLFLSTWFLNGDPRVAHFCRIWPDGRRTTYQYVDAASFNAMKTAKLPQEFVQRLAPELAQLPPSATPRPAMENLLIVSFRQNNVWQTRLYDVNQRPPEVSQIMGIIGAPLP